MGKTLSITLIWGLLFTSCRNGENENGSRDNSARTNTISNDSLYICRNTSWQTATPEMKKDSNFIEAFTTTELVKFDKNQILDITANVLKTTRDSIILFQPPENGGHIIIGRILKDSSIESHQRKINNKKIYWETTSSFKLNNKSFVKISKTDFNWLREVWTKYTNELGKDSSAIYLSGP
jgi:hypothetical protein